MRKEANLDPIAVMGAGAVGCYYGGMLARAGHDVTLIARAQHVEAVQKRGLRMETKAFDANVPVRASAEASGARGAKLVLFSVKSDDVIGALWAKLVVNCAYNALSAITQLPYGRMVQGDGVPAVMRDVVDECLAVARAAGVDVPRDLLQAVPRIAETMPGQFSSTAQDLARGKPTEIDHLNGFVVRKGEGLGVPTPANRVLLALVKLFEQRGSPRE